MASLFHSFIYLPLYNALIFLVGIVPGEGVGIAVILLTILVRIIVFPIAQNAIKAQVALRKIEPEIEAIKEEFKDNKEELARKTLALYKERGIKMSAPFQLLLVQLPLLIGLYWVFLQGGLPSVDPEALYSFVKVPISPDMNFLGIINIGERSILLAVMAGLSQYIFTRLSMPAPSPNGSGFKHDLARSMHIQMRYVLPLMIGVFAYSFSAAIALYWTTGNLFSIAQEIFVKRGLEKKAENNQ